MMFSRPPIDRIAFLNISWYAILIVAAIVLGLFIANREEHRLQLPQDTALDLALWGIPLAVIGARLYFVFFQWDYFSDDLLSIFDIKSGGLAIFGGILGGLLAARIVSGRKNVPMSSILDMVAPSLLIGQAIGRWGNYINMEAFGMRIYDEALQFFPFGVEIPVGNVWYWQMATFFYESAWCLLAFLVLWALRTRTERKGDAFFFYLLLYCMERTVVEGLRDDSLTFYNEFVRVSQIFSAIACLVVIVLFFRRQKASLHRIATLVASCIGFATVFIGEFERGAYAALLFPFAQILLVAMLLFGAVSFLFALIRRVPFSRTLLQLLVLLAGIGVFIGGLNRLSEDNTLYVSLRQIICVFQWLASGFLLYNFTSAQENMQTL